MTVRKNVIIENDGNEIKSTNYFSDSVDKSRFWNKKPYWVDFYLSYNIPVLRLLVHYLDDEVRNFFDRTTHLIIELSEYIYQPDTPIAELR